MAKTYKAKITTKNVTGAFEVTVTADTAFQAKQIIERQHGPVKAFITGPTEVR